MGRVSKKVSVTLRPGLHRQLKAHAKKWSQCRLSTSLNTILSIYFDTAKGFHKKIEDLMSELKAVKAKLQAYEKRCALYEELTGRTVGQVISDYSSSSSSVPSSTVVQYTPVVHPWAPPPRNKEGCKYGKNSKI